MNYLSVLNKDLNLANSTNFNDKFIYLNRACNLKHWNSHFDHKNKVQLMILGRPVIEVLDWAKFFDSIDLNRLFYSLERFGLLRYMVLVTGLLY